MAEPAEPKPVTPITPLKTSAPKHDEKIFCDRCGGEVYRMHAVWRCSQCGYKSDCCGW
jgi:ribosomal protein L37E